MRRQPLFRSTRNNRRGRLIEPFRPTGSTNSCEACQEARPDDRRARAVDTAATNALEQEADIARVQEWLGHANIATARRYDKRKSSPEDSPTSKVGLLKIRLFDVRLGYQTRKCYHPTAYKQW